jgi:hypothetical protein
MSNASKSRNSSTVRLKSVSSLLKESVPKLSTQNELVIMPRELANTALKNNSQQFLDSFLSEEKVQQAFSKILEYNLRETSVLSFEYFIVKLKEEYFYFFIDEEGPKVIPIKSREAKSKFKVLLNKLDSLFKTAGFKICSSVISKTYIQESLQTSDFFVIALGMHKRHTKLKNKLSRETPNKRIDNIGSYDCLGFAFLDRYKKYKDAVYLKAICSNKGFGDKILKITELLCAFMLFNKLYLSSVDTAFPYYISRDYEVIINRKSGKNLKYIVDPSSRKELKKPIPGSKELYGYQGSVMFRKQKSTKAPSASKTNNTKTRRSARTRKRANNNKARQFILQNVSIDSDGNINMMKELSIR